MKPKRQETRASLVPTDERISGTRRDRVRRPGIRTLAHLLPPSAWTSLSSGTLGNDWPTQISICIPNSTTRLGGKPEIRRRRLSVP